MFFIKLATLLVALMLGYLFASFPTGVVVSKSLYQKDIREYGSKNSGATNVGRVLGKKAFWIVIIGDVLKTVLPIWIITLTVHFLDLYNYTWTPWVSYMAALGGTIGHCYPLFAQFKGGKAVSAFGSFVLTTNWILAIFGVLMILLVLKIKKHVSLSSMVASASVVLVSLLLLIPGFENIGMYPLMESGLVYTGFLMASGLFLYWRHRENIVRLLNGTESRISWMK